MTTIDVSESADRGRWPRVALVLILLGYAAGQVAVILLGSGLFLSHDEANFLLEGMRLPVQMKMGGYAHGPVMYALMAVMEIVWYLLARVLGHVDTPVEHLANVLANPSPHIKAARLLVTTAGLLCLIQVYRVTRLLASRWAAVLATLLCACSLTFGVWTGMAKEDVIFWLLLLTAADLMWRAAPGEKLRPALAGVAIGVGFATKYLAFFGMVLALLPLLRAHRERAQAWRQVLVMAAAALVSVIIAYPFLIIDLAGVLASLKGTSASLAGMNSNSRFVAYLVHHLPTLAGPFVGVAALAELAVRLRKEPRGPILLFSPVLLILAFLVTGRGYTAAHYVFPVVIAGFVLAACFAARVSQRLRGRLRALPFLVLAGVALFDPAYLPSRLKFALMVSGPDTRALAAQKVAELVPAGECVVITGGVVGWNNQGPALAPAEVNSTNPSGTFAAAERLAIGKRPAPHYRLRIINEHVMPREVPADCHWLVGHFIAEWSPLEFGPLPIEIPGGDMPPGFVKVAQVDAVPPLHSYYFPFLSNLDYREIRSTPLVRLWRGRAMGPSYLIYKRAGAAP